MTDLVKDLRAYRELCRADSKVWSPSTAWQHFETAADEIARLREQIRLCEISLGTFDEGCSSEYWERYPGNPKHQ